MTKLTDKFDDPMTVDAAHDKYYIPGGLVKELAETGAVVSDTFVSPSGRSTLIVSEKSIKQFRMDGGDK